MRSRAGGARVARTASGCYDCAVPRATPVPNANCPMRPTSLRFAFARMVTDPVARVIARVITRLIARAIAAAVLSLGAAAPTVAQDAAALKKLEGFDAYMAQVMKEWNAPGIAVGVVVKDKLVFAKGYGYRDYGKRLPFTPNTLMQIASNSKLFTATAVGLLVEAGKLEWDQPVRRFAPQAVFFNDELNNTVTLRDMLSHRTGITRHDLIWYKSSFTRAELFERLKYLEPAQPLRTTFLYNNLMYAASGHIIQLLSGRTWEQTVRERFFGPLAMPTSIFDVDEMLATPDHVVPYTERRDSQELYEIPPYKEQAGVGPAGSIISSVNEMSHWLIAQMNGGKYNGTAVIPPAVIKATLSPSIALPNTALETRGWGEVLNSAYGMGRWTASYRGHLLAFHGGDLPGTHSQVSFMPQDSVGVIVFVIGDHAQPLYNIVSYHVYERLLGMSLTPWSERQNTIRLKNKAANKEARAVAGSGRVTGTQPSHPLDDFVGEFVHPAYGLLAVTREGAGLVSELHKIKQPLTHFHYDRFDTPDDERDGKLALNFATSPQGDIDKVTISIDEGEVTFARRPAAILSATATLAQYVGEYLTPSGATIQVQLRESGQLGVLAPGQPFQPLVPWKAHAFKIKEFSDITVRFEVAGGKVTAMVQVDPGGEHRNARK